MTRIARMKGENQPHKNVGAMPLCPPENARYKTGEATTEEHR